MEGMLKHLHPGRFLIYVVVAMIATFFLSKDWSFFLPIAGLIFLLGIGIWLFKRG